MFRSPLIRFSAVAIVAALAMAACGDDGSPAAANNSTAGTAAAGSAGAELPAAKLSLVAYSTPQEAYEKIITAFNATPAGKNITFSKSFGASGDQSRAVASGLDADYVAFSLEPDVTRLVKANLVAPDWNKDANAGNVTDSVVVLVVRKGNPKNIKGWADLTKPGIEVITPNPFTSGGARWNVMAAYGQVIKGGGTEADGVAYLKSLFANVPVQDDSARNALATFSGGKGDVLLSYENEAILAQAKGEDVDYVVPDQTIKIETVAAVTKSAPPAAQKWLDWLYTPEAQKIFADNGYRPVVSGVTGKYDFPTPPQEFTIDDLGGWSKVKDQFFDDQKGIMAKVEQSIGVSTTG